MLLPLLTGCTSIHQSAGRGNLTEIAQYLEKGVDVNTGDEYGKTPMMLASEKGHQNVAQWLSEKGAAE